MYAQELPEGEVSVPEDGCIEPENAVTERRGMSVIIICGDNILIMMLMAKWMILI